MENRREFLKAVMTQIEFWMIHPDLVKVPSRDRITHAVSYAAFAAATAIFDSHGADEVGAFLKFMIQHVSSVIWRPGCAKGGQL